MLIGGLQKTTLIDFPGRVACTIFTIGCNFRCPFCHNRDLVTVDNFKQSGLKDINEQSFFEFLDKRKKILDGVCITGGEPTLKPDLLQFCKKIKALELEVKLDTNGSNPEIIRKLIQRRLVDYIAMDIKAVFSDYEKVINVKCPFDWFDNAHHGSAQGKQNSKLLNSIKESIKIILRSGIEYEFRTTIVPGLHNQDNMIKLAKDIKNEVSSAFAKATADKKVSEVNWVLQNFRPQNCLDEQYLNIKPFTDEELNIFLVSIQKILPKTKLRGEN